MGRDQLIPLEPKLFMPRHVAGHLFHGCLLTLSPHPTACCPAADPVVESVIYIFFFFW